ncbi:MAG: hypothetical protein JWQ56_2761, partial [Pseudarthrobacter sp.]|nr:hypothetical protein [Pseudarthrobacter sp.]
MVLGKATRAGAVLSAVLAATACGGTPPLAADEIVVP